MRPRHALALPAALLAAALAGCDSVPTGPAATSGGGDSGSSTASFSETITSSELGDELASGARRVEIDVLADRLVAREVEVDRSEEMRDDEKIESPVQDIEVGDGSATLVLALGGLRIDFDDGTELEARGEGSRDIGFQAFVDRIETALSEGRTPFVEVKRRPPSEPQAPDDASFVPAEIELEDPDDDRSIEINVDGDNFEEHASPPPQATLTVLGLGIEIREGTTEIERRREDDDREDDDRGDLDFEGRVASVDVGAGSFTLENGTRVRVVEGTEIDGAADDDADDDELASLAEVDEALRAGRVVVARGEGVLESSDPRTLTAIEAEFETGEDDADEPGFEFEGSVTAVDADARTFTLAGGQQVRLDDETRIDPEGDLLSLESAADAVGAGRPVRAEGDAVRASDGVWRALDVKFEVDD